VQGESEVEFQEYLRSLKIVFDNLVLLDPELAMRAVHMTLSKTLSDWQTAPFNDVEVAIR